MGAPRSCRAEVAALARGPARPPGLRLAPRPRWPRAGLSCLAPGAGAPGTRAPRHVPPGGALRKGVEVEEDSERLRAARSREGGGARALKAAVVGGPADPPSRAGASGRAGGARTARARRRPLFRRWAWPGRARARAAAASRRRREPGAGSAARRGAGPSVGPPRASRAARPPARPPCRASTTSSWRSPSGGCCARCAGSPCASPCRSPPAATASATPACRSSSGAGDGRVRGRGPRAFVLAAARDLRPARRDVTGQ